MRNMFNRVALGLTAFSTLALAGVQSAMAQIDTAGTITAITGAESDAQEVGTKVISVIAGLAVVGIVIGLVRKL